MWVSNVLGIPLVNILLMAMFDCVTQLPIQHILQTQ